MGERNRHVEKPGKGSSVMPRGRRFVLVGLTLATVGLLLYLITAVRQEAQVSPPIVPSVIATTVVNDPVEPGAPKTGEVQRQSTARLATPDSAALSTNAKGTPPEGMDTANAAYDRGDFEESIRIAQKLLEGAPGNARMLRIIVSSSCQMGDATTALNNLRLLPAPDRTQMITRCARYGVDLAAP